MKSLIVVLCLLLLTGCGSANNEGDSPEPTPANQGVEISELDGQTLLYVEEIFCSEGPDCVKRLDSIAVDNLVVATDMIANATWSEFEMPGMGLGSGLVFEFFDVTAVLMQYDGKTIISVRDFGTYSTNLEFYDEMHSFLNENNK